VVIHPRFLGKKLRKTVVDTLKADVVGSCIDGAHVIAVLRISDENVSRGVVEPLTGSVRYDVTYRAIMFRPFRNEVLDCVVKQVTAVGSGEDFTMLYSGDELLWPCGSLQLGFFAEAGPLNIFVSRVVRFVQLFAQRGCIP
jgi:DNA-directed RNA polymerase II subunit RPB7